MSEEITIPGKPYEVASHEHEVLMHVDVDGTVAFMQDGNALFALKKDGTSYVRGILVEHDQAGVVWHHLTNWIMGLPCLRCGEAAKL